MIQLFDYKKYWEGVAARVDEVAEAMPVTVDEEMGKRLAAIKAGTVTLFYLPPAAEASGRPDAFQEDNVCVVFIMKKYDPQREQTYDVLADTQKAIEAVKATMINDQYNGCPVMRVDLKTINTLPETEFYRAFAGWSLGFTVKSY